MDIAPLFIQVEVRGTKQSPYAFHVEGRSFELELLAGGYGLIERRMLAESSLIKTWGFRVTPAVLLGKAMIAIIEKIEFAP